MQCCTARKKDSESYAQSRTASRCINTVALGYAHFPFSAYCTEDRAVKWTLLRIVYAARNIEDENDKQQYLSFA